MSFRDKLRTPSWRGMEFAIPSEDKSFGRDVKKQKVINGSAVYYEDVGIKETVFTVEAMIGGNENFVELADQFETLLSQKGSGRLVLPHTGEIKAVVTEARRRTTDNEVGIVYFSITFERDDAPTTTPSGISSSSQLLDAADASYDAVTTDFLAAYREKVPDFVSGYILGNLGTFTDGLTSSLHRIGQLFSPTDFTVGEAVQFADEMTGMFKGLVSAYAPKLNFSVATDTVVSENASPLSVVSALQKTADQITYDASDLTTTTASQTARATNAVAVDLLTRISSITAAGQAAAYAEYESKQEALETRTRLLESMAALRDTAGEENWNNSYMALGTLMATVNRDIDEALGRLPQTVTIQPTTVRSSMLLAHRLYGDNPEKVISFADDIVARNKIAHPSFMPVDDVEVLIDA